jgi:uncharacterized protein YbbC (DUF1343 family)
VSVSGIDALEQSDFAAVRRKRVGLVTHAAALNRQYRSTLQVFREATQCQLVALFGPEHGLHSAAQDLIPVSASSGEAIRNFSLYGDTFASLKPTREMLQGLDVLVIDLQDVGSRYYTFQATMLYCLEACAEVGLPVVVLDRFNPVGLFEVEGPTVQPGFESFVGVHPIATRHGLTMGELARLYRAERVPAVELEVVPVPHYHRDPNVYNLFSFILPPSPNMPTLTTAELYPGLCLIEGTNLSEGRGTTRPFEYVGFPGIDPEQIARRLRAAEVPGVHFLPVTFRPTFQKHAGQLCGGVFLVIEDFDTFRPVRTGLAVVCAFRELLGEQFCWRTETYEFVSHIPAIDLLFGSDRERRAIEAGRSWQEIAQAWEPEEDEFRQRRKAALIY